MCFARFPGDAGSGETPKLPRVVYPPYAILADQPAPTPPALAFVSGGPSPSFI